MKHFTMFPCPLPSDSNENTRKKPLTRVLRPTPARRFPPVFRTQLKRKLGDPKSIGPGHCYVVSCADTVLPNEGRIKSRVSSGFERCFWF